MRLKFKIVFMAAIVCLAVVSVLAGLSLLKLREGVELRKQASIAQSALDDVLQALQEAQIQKLRLELVGKSPNVEAVREPLRRADEAFHTLSENDAAKQPDVAEAVQRLHELLVKDEPLNDSIRKQIGTTDSLLEQEVNTHQLFVDKYFSLNVGALSLFLLFAMALLFAFAVLVADEIRRRGLLEQDLRLAQSAAVSASNLKSQFVATVSHEIRTPLNGIIGMSELIRDRVQGAELRRYAEIMHNSGQNLLRIVNDILDFSKIEANRFEFELQEVRPAQIVESAVELFAKRAGEKKLLVIGSYGRDFHDLFTTDGSRLAQVLNNLVGNAIKFTEKGSVQVHGSVERESDGYFLRFDVRDTGCGFSSEERNLLFKPFNQLPGVRNKEGTGLGLTICKRLVENMNGEIGVSSQVGRGSHFWFRVPVRFLRKGEVPQLEMLMPPPRAVGVGLPPELDRFLQSSRAMMPLHYQGDSHWPQDFTERDIVFIREAMAMVSPHTPGAPHIVRLPEQITPERLVRALRVGTQPHATMEVAALTPANGDNALLLLVEDNATNQILAQVLLESMGYRVHIAGNGKECLEALRRVRYDLVLMDCRMPEMDGFQATRQIRELEMQEGWERLPIVAITANAQDGDREKCLAAGMDDYITKPFNPALLNQMVRRWARTGSPALDWDVIKQLAARTNHEIVRRLMESMQVTLTASIPKLENGKAAADWAGISGLAHQLKASSATLGALRFSEFCETVESEIDAGAMPSVDQLDGMIRSAQQVLEEIRSRRLFK